MLPVLYCTSMFQGQLRTTQIQAHVSSQPILLFFPPKAQTTRLKPMKTAHHLTNNRLVCTFTHYQMPVYKLPLVIDELVNFFSKNGNSTNAMNQWRPHHYQHLYLYQYRGGKRRKKNIGSFRPFQCNKSGSLKCKTRRLGPSSIGLVYYCPALDTWTV